MQSFNGVVKPLGERARRGRCCACSATCSGSPGSTTTAPAEVARASPAPMRRGQLATVQAGSPAPPAASPGLERIADVPIYFADPLVRRAAALQRRATQAPPRGCMSRRCSPGSARGRPVRVRQVRGAPCSRPRSTRLLADGVSGSPRRIRRRAARRDVRPIAVERARRRTPGRAAGFLASIFEQARSAWPLVWTLVKIVAIAVPLILASPT